MKKNWRLLQTGYSDAATNMAIDEALLSSYQEGLSLPTLRIYGWKPAAFSIGYSQDPEAVLRMDACVNDRIPVVRRLTGGGVIFHNDELTYSLVFAPGDMRLEASVLLSYRRLCSFIIAAYKKVGCAASYAVEVNPLYFRNNDVQASFCFAGCEKYDILIGDKKIGGSAQKRMRAVVLQHGSIPLSSGIDKAYGYLKEKPFDIKSRTCSLEEAAGRRVGFEAFSAVLSEAFKETFQIDFEQTGLNKQEQKLAAYLKDEKYAYLYWNKESTRVDSSKKAAVA